MVGSRRGLLVAILVWLVLFGLTVQVGISDWVLKSLLEDPTATIVGAAVDLLLLIPLVLTHRALMRDLLLAALVPGVVRPPGGRRRPGTAALPPRPAGRGLYRVH